jgi:flagellar motility protein MotE (MotC chaperone)
VAKLQLLVQAQSEKLVRMRGMWGSNACAYACVRIRQTSLQQCIRRRTSRAFHLLPSFTQNSLQAQLADAEQRGNAADGKHRARLREVARRLQAEHGTRLAALQEANDQLLAELAGQQEAMVQLPAAREELCATKARCGQCSAGWPSGHLTVWGALG